MAVPQPPSTSQKVPRASAPSRELPVGGIGTPGSAAGLGVRFASDMTPSGGSGSDTWPSDIAGWNRPNPVHAPPDRVDGVTANGTETAATSPDPKIIYTHTDEAPLLATYSFLPIVEAYAAK